MKKLLKKFDLLNINGFRSYAPLNGGNMSQSAIFKKCGEKVVVKFLLFPRNEFELNLFKSEIENLNLLSKITGYNYVAKSLSGLLKHPDHEIYYFMVEYIDGITLNEYFNNNKLPLPVNDAVSLLSRCAAALGSANVYGVVHKDFHEGNIMILNNQQHKDDDPGIRIIDLGLSVDYFKKMFTEEPMVDTLRHIGAVSSWSPEYLDDPNSISPSHDIWALGVLFFKMLTGNWAFKEDSFGEYYNLVKNGNYNKALLDNFTQERLIHHLVSRMFDINPDSRIKQHAIFNLCMDFLDARTAMLKKDKSLEDLYFQYDGDIWMCPHCAQIVHPNGVICPVCHNREDEYLPF